MQSNNLKSLKRDELLKMMLQQAKELESLKQEMEARNSELEQYKKRLEGARPAAAKREVSFDEPGAITDAALQLNGIFEVAQAAGQQYIENIQRLSEHQENVCAQRDAASRAEAEAMLAQTRQKCQEMEENARLRVQMFWKNPAHRLYSSLDGYQRPVAQPVQPVQQPMYQQQPWQAQQPAYQQPQSYQQLPVMHPYTQPMEQPFQQPMHQTAQQPLVQQPVQQPMHQPMDQQPMHQPVYRQQPQTYQEQPVMHPYTQPVQQQPVQQQPVQQPVYQQPVHQPAYQQHRVYRGQSPVRHGEVRQPRQRENRGVVRLDSWYASPRMNDPMEAEEEYAY